MSLRLPLALLLALALSSLAIGQDTDPPGRVARISLIRGEVSLQAADAQAPEEALLNRPVTFGERLTTGSSSRAELTLGTAAIRLDEHTNVFIAELDDEIARLEVDSGAASITLRELYEGEAFEIDLPNAAVRLLTPGEYRVDVLADGTVRLAVRQGEAEMDDGNQPLLVRAGEEARLAPYERAAHLAQLAASDEFDDWSLDREQQLTDVEAARYVSQDVVGYEDLDRYGSWYYEREYGHVWAPRYVSHDWAPYRFGSWVWLRPWGWTWVDKTPWGFAPFHYGRWAHVRNRWCWVPGPRHHRAVFAPALVTWSDGHSRRRHHSRDYRPRHWEPLAPHELYVPAHRATQRYLRTVNPSHPGMAPRIEVTRGARRRLQGNEPLNRETLGTESSRRRRALDDRVPAAHILNGANRPVEVIRGGRETRVMRGPPTRDAARVVYPPRAPGNATTREQMPDRWRHAYRTRENAVPGRSSALPRSTVASPSVRVHPAPSIRRAAPPPATSAGPHRRGNRNTSSAAPRPARQEPSNRRLRTDPGDRVMGTGRGARTR